MRAEDAARAHVDAAGYERLYAEARDDAGRLLARAGEAARLDDGADAVGDWSFDEADFRIRWFADGALNVSANCLDRHLAARGEQTAIMWEGDDPAETPRGSAMPSCTARSAGWPTR